MIFITGDLHGDHDIHKFSTSVFKLQKELTRSDYMIICGDFGLIWANTSAERYWLKWLDSKPWTTLWIDGNHENFDLLKDTLQKIGKVARYSELQTISFIFAGAASLISMERKSLHLVVQRAMIRNIVQVVSLSGTMNFQMRQK